MSWSNLVSIIAKLRSPEGCPWDRAQTHESLKRFLLEETYELFEAIDAANPQAIKDELGDVLLQVLLHAQIAQERAISPWKTCCQPQRKAGPPPPHVFGEVSADTQKK